jgi:hypothetical protein
VAAYVMLVRHLAAARLITISGIRIDAVDVEGVVARIDDQLRRPQDFVSLEALDLTAPIEDLVRLLALDGPFDRAFLASLDDLPYALEPKCDACVFGVHCLPETARQRRIELIGASPGTVAALRAEGVGSLDALATLDLGGNLAAALRANDAVDEDIEHLAIRARARLMTLPGGDDIEGYRVEGLPRSGLSQLPPHEIEGRRLVRIYMVVDYDYVEDRIASISAHITASDHELRTPFMQDASGRWRPAARVIEVPSASVGDAPPTERGLSGRTIVRIKAGAWTGDSVQDAAAERELLDGFFQELVAAIAVIAEAEEAPLHFYVWSRNEVTRLMEACARGGPALIRHMRELLGCRPGREQLIVTALQSEVDRKFALGWTGRGLSVVAGLPWFGQSYHWRRRIGIAEVDLDRVFEQDVFDYRTTLAIRPNGSWAADGEAGSERVRFEVRARFNDSLSMPYYAVAWGRLRSTDARWADDALARRAIERYERILQPPGLLSAYLEARSLALRWIEERLRFKNDTLEKPAFSMAELGTYQLGVNSPRGAAIDVLRIDWQVRYGEWRAAQTLAASARVAAGRCLPLADVEVRGGRGVNATAVARIAPELVGLTLEDLERRYGEEEGSFVRLMPWSGNPAQPAQLNNGATCVIDAIDWATRRVVLAVRPQRRSEYALGSFAPTSTPFALLEQSVTDFVAPRVERRLNGVDGVHVDAWFDLSAPDIDPIPPIAEDPVARVRRAIEGWRIPETGDRLLPEQIDAAVSGARARVQALQGPPGTGKTATTVVAIAVRTSLLVQPGQIVIVAGPTHRAVDTLANRLAQWAPSLRTALADAGAAAPALRIVRLDPRVDSEVDPSVERVVVPRTVTESVVFIAQQPSSVTVLCGTPTALLKLEETLGQRHALNAMLLVVDEASMMVFPHVLALASLTQVDASILVAGDNRQLAPILAHAWDREDRPPTLRYQPFLSAYEAVARISDVVLQHPMADRRIVVSRLRHSFRLPPAHRAVVSTVYRRRDALELTGRAEPPGPMDSIREHRMSCVWNDRNGLILIRHKEQNSRKENPLERQLIREIIAARRGAPDHSIAVLTPHRAQRARLREEFDGINAILAVDTVERLQGGEAETVIVSATASEPSAVINAEEFLLSVNRANVAFSRATKRLIVIVSETVLNYVSADLEVYEAALLWKELRRTCTRLLLDELIDGINVQVLAMQA